MKTTHTLRHDELLEAVRQYLSQHHQIPYNVRNLKLLDNCGAEFSAVQFVYDSDPPSYEEEKPRKDDYIGEEEEKEEDIPF